MENIEFRLQRCLNKVETWATENGFKLSLQYTTKLAANPKSPAHNCVLNSPKLKPSMFIFVS